MNSCNLQLYKSYCHPCAAAWATIKRTCIILPRFRHQAHRRDIICICYLWMSDTSMYDNDVNFACKDRPCVSKHLCPTRHPSFKMLCPAADMGTRLSAHEPCTLTWTDVSCLTRGNKDAILSSTLNSRKLNTSWDAGHSGRQARSALHHRTYRRYHPGKDTTGEGKKHTASVIDWIWLPATGQL